MLRYDLMHWSQRVRDEQVVRETSTYPLQPAPPVDRPRRTHKSRAKRPPPVRDAIADELLDLCEAGRLYEIEAWIAAGKPLTVPAHYKTTPLGIARRTGFHSLIELLLRHETSQSAKDALLLSACQDSQRPIVDLALKYGANAKVVPLYDALLTFDRWIVSTMLAHGADPIADYPFARAFGQRIKTILGCYLDAKRDHPELADALQEQADMALRQACSDENLKWVCLMLWVGANPRSKGLLTEDLDNPDADNDPEARRSALEVGTWANVEILKRLKPHPEHDNLNELMSMASSTWAKPEILRYLLQLGATPNDKANGGSSALDALLRYPHPDRPSSVYEPRRVLSASNLTSWRSALRMLIERGAHWRPEHRTLGDARRALYSVEPAVVAEVVDVLELHRACEQEVLRELVRTPKMQAMLRAHARGQLDMQRRSDRVPRQAAKRATVTPPPEPPRIEFYAGFKRQKLYEEVWAEPTQTVAKRHGVSDVMIAKACKQLKVPKPPRGYWAKVTAGRPVPSKPSLP